MLGIAGVEGHQSDKQMPAAKQTLRKHSDWRRLGDAMALTRRHIAIVKVQKSAKKKVQKRAKKKVQQVQASQ